MASRARWRTAFALAMVASSGCYWLTPYDDLTDGRAEPDGSVGAADATAADATADAGRFCGTVDAFFCDDFDDGTLDAWAGAHVTAPDLLEITSDASVSPPRSVLFAIPFDAGTTDAVYLEKALGTASAVDVDFDIHLDAAESNQDISFLCRLSIGRWSTDLWALPGTSNIVEVVDGGVHSHGLAWKPRFGADTPWVHVTLSVAIGADGGTATVTGGDQSTTFALDPIWRADKANLQLGFFHVNAPAHQVVVRYDNVVVTVRSGT